MLVFEGDLDVRACRSEATGMLEEHEESARDPIVGKQEENLHAALLVSRSKPSAGLDNAEVAKLGQTDDRESVALDTEV
jgi:hypothetical protein